MVLYYFIFIRNENLILASLLLQNFQKEKEKENMFYARSDAGVHKH